MANEDKEQHEKILADARDFLKEAKDYWQDTYDRGSSDKEFVTVEGAQWDAGAKAKRKAEDKPTLEINLARTYTRQKINEMRQNRPQIQVVPVDSNADLEVARIIGGLIKDTEEGTDAEDAYDQAGENAVLGGIGFFRLTTDYVSEDSFNQEPKFLTIENPQAVYMDPLSRKLDGSDQSRCLVCEWVKKSSVEKQYGEDAVDFENDSETEWDDRTKDSVLIAEYFYKEEVKDKLLMLSDGSTIFKSEALKEWSKDDLEAFTVQERDTLRTEVKWAKLSGCKVLETGVFPGKFIPIIPVYGEVTWIREKRYVFSLIHFAKDAQRLFNYWKSTEAHILSKNQDDILVADAKGVAGHEEQWQDPGRYKAVYYNFFDSDSGGQVPIPAPMRIGAAQPPTGILNAAVTSQQLISDTLNMHAPQMGQDVNQQSGKAIGLLQRQADTAHFHFQDNLNKSLKHAGRILIGLYQSVYDVELVRRIIGVDGEAEMVALNAPPRKPDEADKAIHGLLNNLTVGRYDVRMDTGPSMATQREQSFQLMLQLMQFNPEIAAIAGDLIIKDSPLVNAKTIAERLKKKMDPSLLEDGESSIPPAVQAQVQQMDQLIQQMTQQLQKAQGELNDKNAERNVEVFKAELQAQKDIQVAQINAASRSDVQELRSVAELLKQQMNGIQNAMQHIPDQWLQQGEGVDNYTPSQLQQIPQSDGFEPPPDMSQPDLQDPANEQGFLMPEESAQEQFAPEISQFGESATAENGGLMPPMENLDGSEQF